MLSTSLLQLPCCATIPFEPKTNPLSKSIFEDSLICLSISVGVCCAKLFSFSPCDTTNQPAFFNSLNCAHDTLLPEGPTVLPTLSVGTAIVPFKPYFSII